MCYNYYHYRCNRRKSIFIGIVVGILLLIIFDSTLHKSLNSCDDEFQGDEDDCDCK